MKHETFMRGPCRLIHSVIGRKDRPYTHICDEEIFTKVAHAVDETESCTAKEVATAEGVPSTQVSVAFAFLRERGILIPIGRRHVTSSPSVFEDAMTEYHALGEEIERVDQARAA